MALRPPYPISTIADARLLDGLLSRGDLAVMEKFEAQSKIVRPPLLELLPKRIDVTIEQYSHSFVEEYPALAEIMVHGRGLELLEQLRDRVVHSAHELGDNKFATESKLLRAGIALEKSLGGTVHADEEEPLQSAPRRLSQLLETRDALHAQLARLLRRHLSTRDQRSRAFVERALCTLTLFAPGSNEPDHQLLNRLRNATAGSARAVLDLDRLFGERLGLLKQQLFDAQMHRLIELTRERILSIEGPVNFRRNGAALVDVVAQERTAETARNRLDRLAVIFRETVKPAAVVQMRSQVENLCDKVDAFDDFFEEGFARSALSRIREAEIPASVWRSLAKKAQTTRILVSLYPTKDLHDLLKGKYSGDCTAQTPLAKRQLAHPRFFNMRLFRADAWIGNVYALDYSEQRALLIDRVQIGERAGFSPFDFFKPFFAALGSALPSDKPISILGPSVISNYTTVQRSYERWRSGKARCAHVFDKGDEIFESACGSLPFRLWTRPPGTRQQFDFRT